MPVRIRKSFNLFPGVKVNMSKGGMSITVGRKGFHLNFSKRGVRQTVGLPGSGISESSYIFKNKDDEDKKEKETEKEERSSEAAEEKPKRQQTRRTARERVASPWGFFAFVFVALFFIYFRANAFGLLPPNLITNFLHTLTQWAQQIGL
jgi:Fe2+ transport system protein B